MICSITTTIEGEMVPKRTSYLVYASLSMCVGLCYLYFHCLKKEPKSILIAAVGKQLVIRASCVIAVGQLLLLFSYSEVFTSKELMLTFTVWEWLAGSGVYYGFVYQTHPYSPTVASPSVGTGYPSPRYYKQPQQQSHYSPTSPTFH